MLLETAIADGIVGSRSTFHEPRYARRLVARSNFHFRFCNVEAKAVVHLTAYLLDAPRLRDLLARTARCVAPRPFDEVPVEHWLSDYVSLQTQGIFQGDVFPGIHLKKSNI